jgi:hypothetical protein
MDALYGTSRNSNVPKRLDTTHIGTQECINHVFIILVDARLATQHAFAVTVLLRTILGSTIVLR